MTIDDNRLVRIRLRLENVMRCDVSSEKNAISRDLTTSAKELSLSVAILNITQSGDLTSDVT